MKKKAGGRSRRKWDGSGGGATINVARALFPESKGAAGAGWAPARVSTGRAGVPAATKRLAVLTLAISDQ